MSITAKVTSVESNPVEVGVHIGVCTRIIDLGSQYNEKFDLTQHKIMLTWEVADDMIEVDGEMKPKMISKEYTLSLSDKANLRRDLEAWRGKAFSDTELMGFDLINVLGKTCQLQVLQNDRGYAYIGSIMALPKGTPSVEPATQTIYFDLENKSCLTMIDNLPTWISDKIKASPEYSKLVSNDNEFSEILDDTDDDLPF